MRLTPGAFARAEPVGANVSRKRVTVDASHCFRRLLSLPSLRQVGMRSASQANSPGVVQDFMTRSDAGTERVMRRSCDRIAADPVAHNKQR